MGFGSIDDPHVVVFIRERILKTKQFILVQLIGILLLLGLSACASKPTSWETPPEMAIDPEAVYIATLETEKGDIVIELFADRAPITVNNFVFLAEQGYYDNTTFHRVIEGFMAQGGDPTATGTGGPGYQFEDEIDPTLRFDGPGYLAMANGGPNTNGSQFFITYADTSYLNGQHTIFGKVVEGMDVALSLTPRDPSANPTEDGDALRKVSIETVAESLLPPPTPTPIPITPELEDGRPLAALPVEQRGDQYTGRPAMLIDPDAEYQARVTTTQGEFVISLDSETAPESVNNFVVLAQLGFYDGFPINYVDPAGFLLTGAPSGSPDSDIGFGIPIEVGLSNMRGAVGMWLRMDGMGASGSQFYILTEDLTELDGGFPIFGQISEGLDVVEALTIEDQIERIVIEKK